MKIKWSRKTRCKIFKPMVSRELEPIMIRQARGALILNTYYLPAFCTNYDQPNLKKNDCTCISCVDLQDLDKALIAAWLGLRTIALKIWSCLSQYQVLAWTRRPMQQIRLQLVLGVAKKQFPRMPLSNNMRTTTNTAATDCIVAPNTRLPYQMIAEIKLNNIDKTNLFF